MPQVADFDYALPRDRIAQKPLSPRDASRLLVYRRANKEIEHKHFTDLVDYLNPGDVLVINDTRVLRARLFGRKLPSGGRVELVLLEKRAESTWQVMVGGKRMKVGTEIEITSSKGEPYGLKATIMGDEGGAIREVHFDSPIEAHLEAVGHVPLPPYIHEELLDPERYQTIYAHNLGSAAAPTAGLHFTPELLLRIREKGVYIETITLHVGLDTFKPVESDIVEEHVIHSEWASLKRDSAQRINNAKLSGGRIIAVGTTCVRVLETAGLRSAGIQGTLSDISQRDAEGKTNNICPWRPVTAFEGRTDLFIYPGYQFRAVDMMITNFHLPRSTLLMLVSAFCGLENLRYAYQIAIEHGYRFYSFGDAMLIY